MKKITTAVLLVVLLGVAGVYARLHFKMPEDPKVMKFQASADTLLQGLEQYKEFVGSYPIGPNAEVIKALQGKSPKKVVIVSTQKSVLNDKGEAIDPWGTPLKFYFSGNSVLIRSAGPNKAWDDSSVPNSDDLYRSN
ncbi:MAG TPA: hypothetical protein VKA67_10635 [Verrucomicrobiae bacterium]|nr:hypothetical protein [Verrucomicrobiae bacterium]